MAKKKKSDAAKTDAPAQDGQPTHELGMIPYGAIDVDQRENARRKIGDVTELAESIKRKGLLEPLIVIRLAAPQGELGDDMVPRVPEQRYRLVAGYRRHKAIGIAINYNPQWLTPASIMRSDTSADDVIGANLIENLQREDLHSYDLARGFLRLSQEHDLPGAAIARLVGKSPGYVNNLLRALQNLAPEIVTRWADHDPIMTPRVAVELSALPPEEQLRRIKLISDRVTGYQASVSGDDEEGEGGSKGKKKPPKKAVGIDTLGRPLPTVQAELAGVLKTKSGFALPASVRKLPKGAQEAFILGLIAALEWTSGAVLVPPVSGVNFESGKRGRPKAKTAHPIERHSKHLRPIRL